MWIIIEWVNEIKFANILLDENGNNLLFKSEKEANKFAEENLTSNWAVFMITS
jgi:hypothetical protein